MNLACQLKPNSFFFLIEDYGKIKNLLKSYNFNNIFCLKKEIDLETDLIESTRIIKQKKINLLIVDKFDTNTKQYVKKMRHTIKTVVIPDVQKIDYDADLIANGFIGFKNKIIHNRYGTKCLLGPKYQILNKQFKQNNINTTKKYTLLATFGGFDEHNIIDILCQELEKFLNQITVKIILGPATKKSKNLKSLESKFPKRIQVIQETKDMKKEISQCKFGLCSGGITTYEFATLGIPFAMICQYEHQVNTAKEWEKRKIALNLGLPSNRTRKKICNLIKNIVENKISIKSNNTIVDGLGAHRVAEEIMKI